MSRYVKLNEHNAVVEGPMALPSSYKNISGLKNLSQAKLKELGFYPYEVLLEPEYDPRKQRVRWRVVIEDTKAVMTPEVVELSSDHQTELFEKAKQEAKDKAADIRWQTMDAGVTYQGHTFYADERTLLALSMNMTYAEPKRWKTKDGTWVRLTRSQMQEVFEQIKAKQAANFDHEADLSEDIDAADTWEVLDTIDVTGGWHD